MSQGRIRAEGTSLRLKREFGLGYTLVLTKSSHCTPTTPILAFVQRHLLDRSAEVVVVSDYHAELALQLPLSEFPKFPSLLRGLETATSVLGVEHYVLSMTTLEDVFLRLENEKLARHDDGLEGESNHDFGRSFEERRARYRLSQQDRPVKLRRVGLGGKGFGCRQLWVLLAKRLLVTLRDPIR
jgi:hypothetical protein